MSLVAKLVLGIGLTVAGALELEKVSFPDQLDQSGSQLVLNGAGLRVKRKLGMNFRVYVAGFYVTKKNHNSSELLLSPEAKVLRLVFLRSLDKDTLREAWSEGYAKNCKTTCAATQPQLKAFNDLMADVRDQSELNVVFKKDGVDVEVKGKESHSGHIAGEAFSQSLLAVFIGDPPTEELKKGLLGN